MKKDINKIVLEYVKSQKVNVLLRHTELEEDIHVSIFDFIGKDDKYHSIFICYNDTRIFNTSDTMLLGELNNDILVNLENSHRIFDTREDWLAGRYPDMTNKDLRLYKETLKPCNKEIHYNDFELNRIELTLNPIFAFVVEYSYKGVAQKSLILVADQITDCSHLYPNSHRDFVNFIKMIGLDYLITTHEKMEVF